MEDYSQNDEQDQEANAIIDTLKRQLGNKASDEKLVPTPTLKRMDTIIG